MFTAFAVLYGFYETTNGNWSQLDMTGDLHASATQASVALTAFWGMVTVGPGPVRHEPALVPPQRTYHLLPFLLAVSGVTLLLVFAPELVLLVPDLVFGDE